MSSRSTHLFTRSTRLSTRSTRPSTRSTSLFTGSICRFTHSTRVAIRLLLVVVPVLSVGLFINF